MSARILLLAILLLPAVVGCGQKGPLYLPEGDGETDSSETE